MSHGQHTSYTSTPPTSSGTTGAGRWFGPRPRRTAPSSDDLDRRLAGRWAPPVTSDRAPTLSAVISVARGKGRGSADRHVTLMRGDSQQCRLPTVISPPRSVWMEGITVATHRVAIRVQRWSTLGLLTFLKYFLFVL